MREVNGADTLWEIGWSRRLKEIDDRVAEYTTAVDSSKSRIESGVEWVRVTIASNLLVMLASGT